MTPPELVTDRLVLRAHRVEDFDDVAALWAEAEVARRILGRPATRAEAWARLLRYIGHWPAMGFGYWTLRDRASGAYLGEAGLAEFRRDCDPSVEGAPEMGWVLCPAARGRGLAAEAGAAITAWADAALAAPRIVALIAPDHPASLRVAVRLGFAVYAEGALDGAPTRFLERRSGAAAAAPHISPERAPSEPAPPA